MILDEFFTQAFTQTRKSSNTNDAGEAVETWSTVATGFGWRWPNSGRETTDYATQGIESSDTLACYVTDFRQGDRMLIDGVLYLVAADANSYSSVSMIDIDSYSTVPLRRPIIG